jgi:two-component system sensor histidine kinase UhpB
MTISPAAELAAAIDQDSAVPLSQASAHGAAPLADRGRQARRSGAPTWRRLMEALWYRRTVRAQLLITFALIELVAALVAGGVTIFKARTSTRVEIAASMKLAELLVSETIPLMDQNTPAEQSLAGLPLQLRFLRHVRIAVKDAQGRLVSTRPVAETSETPKADDRAPAPAWFGALIAPPVEAREVPVVVGGQRIGTVLVTGEPADEIAEVWENTVAQAWVALIVGLAVLGLLYILLGRILDPLVGLGRGLLDLERRNYRVRLRRPGARELAGITDRFNALAEALDTARAENSRLNHRLITAQDDERRRTALELHDEVGPCLFGLKANATSITTIADALPGQTAVSVRERAGDMLGILDHLQAINRSLLNRLRPMALGHIPLGDLLSEVVRERARQYPHIGFTFTAGALAPSYGDSIDLTIYRCVQEGLTNAIRHAEGKTIAVALGESVPDGKDARRTRRLTLSVRDDGRGIAAGTPAGLGLSGMQERVAALDGDYDVVTAPGRGTGVNIAIPLPERQDGASGKAGGRKE